ncbi:Sushi, von Willebrand factor type A, EGF and pentraxin domain-containing protein 1 [Geodia barretti]|uniref:Sushi, von Willebrand factor type A, EGF and pentraxin domain-containing protein 1 n=1 Tax=Geodia barretti TaxID=519541 RepID=A0AA35SVP1_GEOBA|nr:Sushi, von Willebrand factor type A, EGF and pentraxin domain-containing protein 1 [Geodia barretti]
MFSATFHQLLLVAVVMVGTSYSQQHYCSYPSSTELESVIAAIIASGDAAAEPTITLLDFNPVCRSFTDRQDLLRGVSVVVQYTCSGHSNCRSGTVVEQIESGCERGKWSIRVEGSTSFTRSESTEASLSTTAREDCSACVSPELASSLGVTTDSVTHCVACNSTCDQGLMRCFGFGASDCCNFYNNSVCVEQCPSPFMSNSDSICVCPEGKTGHNCEDDIVCEELETTNAMVGYTNTTMINSVAIYSCDDGYSLVGDASRTCLETGLWSGTAPTCNIDCGALEKPVSGSVSFSNGTVMGSLATYSCDAGYAVQGNTTRTCLASGSWSATAPTCEKACEVTDCYSCESDVIKCDACSGGKAYDEKSGNCASIECMECDDCDGLLGGLIAVAAVLLIVLVAVAVTISLCILGKKKVGENAVRPSETVVDEKLLLGKE